MRFFLPFARNGIAVDAAFGGGISRISINTSRK
jgi:hypothetical protein